MRGVLLVDDERSVLDNLVKAMDFAEYGFQHLYTASSAAQALDILKAHPIDLLISDIQMPGIDGLDMLRTVRASYPDTHCVLISAHEKFEYAKQALKMGVENYLLKPIDMRELRETVHRTVENIRHAVGISDGLFAKNILERWLYGRISTDELVEHSQYTGLNVLMRQYRVVAVRTRGDVGVLLARIEKGLSIDLIANEMTAADGTGVLLVGGREVDEDMVREAARGPLSADPGAQAACGALAMGNGEVAQSMASALHTLAYAALANLEGWIGHDAIDWSMLTDARIAGLGDLLNSALPSQRVQAWVEDAVCGIGRDAAALRSFYAQTCLALSRLYEESFSPNDAGLFPPFTPPHTPERLQSLMTGVVIALGKRMRTQIGSLSPVTLSVRQYILENLSSPITIKQFAEQTHRNAAYIGRLFKDETGMYFSDFLCMTRINKAKKLLEGTGLSVGDIARQVGIYDVSYFTQRFKKQEHMSPMKYRQAVHAQGMRG